MAQRLAWAAVVMGTGGVFSASESLNPVYFCGLLGASGGGGLRRGRRLLTVTLRGKRLAIGAAVFVTKAISTKKRGFVLYLCSTVGKKKPR